MKIGIVGAPGSGKSTLAARLYATLRESGFENSFLVQEYAREWVANMQRLPTFDQQRAITNRQYGREMIADSVNRFSPIVCDSCLWLGPIYAQFGKLASFAEIEKYRNWTKEIPYDVTIMVPLFDLNDHTSNSRKHDNSAAIDIQTMIVNYIDSNVSNVVNAPKALADRQAFIEDFVKRLTP
jgi:adenylate kinase family enzyme